MSKDKGVKNIKKAPADKSAGRGKPVSAYKSEGKIGVGKSPTLNAFIPKDDTKGGDKKKS